MKIESARFIISSPNVKECPKPDKPEFAFIGRSNVGKSSLINYLCGRKNLAKTSGTPGKTQLINHFLIDENWYLVDLPGYGYAKVSKTKREKWDAMTRKYLLERINLVVVFILIDLRIPPQKSDLSFMEFLGEKMIPFVMVFTKCDGLSKVKLDKQIAQYRREMLKNWHEIPQYFVTSATKKLGREELLSFIQENLSKI